jgi:PAS domain S-box-containing protein
MVADLKFLIIGNDPESLEPVGSAVNGLGHESTVAATVDLGMQLAQTGEYDIAMVDITGPDDRTMEVLKQIHDLKTFSDLVVITDRDRKKQAIHLLNSDVWAYLEKPVEPEELKVVVDRIDGFSCLRREVSNKSRRLSHLEVLNEITRETLLSQENDTLLWYLARLINEKFNYYNVNIFLMNAARDRAVLRAFAGGFGDDFVVGYSLGLGEGVVGWAAQNRQSLLIGDVRKDSRRIQGFAFEEHVLSELAVPIMFEDKVLGVIHTESVELNAFTRDDVMVLETIADQIALSFEKSRLSRELVEAHQLSAAINDSLPVSIVIVDRELKIEYVNRTFYDMYGLRREDFLHQPVQRFFSRDLTTKFILDQELAHVLETGNPVTHSNIRYTSPEHPEKVITVSFFRVHAGTFPRVMILIQDVTDFTKKAYQLSLLREISIAMQGCPGTGQAAAPHPDLRDRGVRHRVQPGVPLPGGARGEGTARDHGGGADLPGRGVPHLERTLQQGPDLPGIPGQREPGLHGQGRSPVPGGKHRGQHGQGQQRPDRDRLEGNGLPCDQRLGKPAHGRGDEEDHHLQGIRLRPADRKEPGHRGAAGGQRSSSTCIGRARAAAAGGHRTHVPGGHRTRDPSQ